MPKTGNLVFKQDTSQQSTALQSYEYDTVEQVMYFQWVGNKARYAYVEISVHDFNRWARMVKHYGSWGVAANWFKREYSANALNLQSTFRSADQDSLVHLERELKTYLDKLGRK